MTKSHSHPACILFVLANYCLLLSYLSNVVAIGWISRNSSINIQCISHEREALLKFKQGIEDDHCDLLSSWGDPNQPDCCTWHGVRCNLHTGHVIMLDLHGYLRSPFEDCGCLQGKVGPSLFELKHLTYLDLSINSFNEQPIPNFIGSLSNLQHLNLSQADFSGEIPPELGNLSKLTSLDLSIYIVYTMGYDYGMDRLTVKGMDWLSHLTLLRVINLSGVDFSKATNSWLQIINNLPFLTTLQMDQCKLISPKIPSSISYVNSTSTLAVLSLMGNQLNDNSIFQWLFNLSGTATHLLHLDLSHNSIPGPIPRYFGNMLSLSYLDISRNKLQGQIPSAFGNMLSLSYLDISSNELQGQIPSAFWNAHSLVYLDLSKNLNLSSTSTPPKLCDGGGLCSLQTLDLSHCNFTDDVSSIFQLFSTCPNSSLEYLDLSQNQLQGTLSKSHLSKLSRLNTLGLSHNLAIIINISASWIPPFQLDQIGLSSCKLGPSFSKWLFNQTNFSWLDLSNTGISDSIPASFWNSLSPSLIYLDMSHNNIHGTLPNFTTVFYNTRLMMDLSWNFLEGALPSIPVSVSELHLNNNKFSDSSALLCPTKKMFLDTLDLSNNLLTGKLPDCWMNFDQLSNLFLGNNYFTGHLPASIGALTSLWSLELRNNDFSGELPMFLKNIEACRYLDISHKLITRSWGIYPHG